MRKGHRIRYIVSYLVIPTCEKAAQEKGLDPVADINCVKYALSTEKDCWPCICKYAKAAKIKIKGCDHIANLLKMFSKLSNLRVRE